MAGGDKMALYKSGITRFGQQDFQGALEDFNAALALDPDFGDVHQSVAHVHEKLGDYDAAIEAAKKAVACNPDDVLTHTSLSIFYQRKGKIAEAEVEKALAAELQQKSSGA